MRGYFTKTEIAIWSLTMVMIVGSFLLFDRSSYLNLTASVIGATALIFCAKGNPIGQALMVVFGLIYAYISLACAYYGELITYIGMTVPMAVASLVSWLENPYKGNRAEVTVNRVHRQEVAWMLLLTAAVTAVFYFVLRAFGTAQLAVSTFSVATSFAAVYLTYRRSPYYALAYALNDVVLIILWVLATVEDIHYISVVICFSAFLINDIYTFICWQRMYRRQQKKSDD